MSKTKAPSKTPSPARVQPASNKKAAASNPRTEFLTAVANMSWQLAIVVLIPIIGGFKLDEAIDTLPAFTIIGFILAMCGMAAVVWRQLQIYAPPLPKEKRL